ncbi:MAG TPA: transcription antitermination factor NusB [Candidatus Saccharimonadales bacterium]|nr:transcription antitermination factor NusB [Candidatus Saccharimonadales bacterium]
MVNDHKSNEDTLNNDQGASLGSDIPQPANACETLDQVIQSRRKTRSLVFHILYAVDALDYDVTSRDVAAKLNAEYETDIPLDGDIVSTVAGVAQHKQELDATLIPFLENWKFERIGKCTLLVLRYAIWEILYTNTSHNIILNEAIELAKCFSEKDAYKFVNGILDKISKQHKNREENNNKKIDEV